MSNVLVREEPVEPIEGRDAFLGTSRSAVLSRAANHLAMAIYAFNGGQASAQYQDDADELRVPHIERLDEEAAHWREQSALDELTNLALEHHAPDVEWQEAGPQLWDELSRTHQPTTLLALLNTRQHSEEKVEAAAAAAGLYAFSGGALTDSQAVLERLLAQSDDEIARAIAAVTLQPESAQAGVEPTPPTTDDAISTTIHGTWALVTDDGWYKPRAPMHSYMHETVSRNLYSRDGYYMWSGGYTDLDREEGARDLVRWRDKVTQSSRFDVVLAHSHGGNVALNALAAGAQMKLLVLLHTPAIHRPDEEWDRIRRNVGGVVAMRTRMDLVVMADSIRHREARGKFDPRKLPHFPVTGHWASGDAWFSHSFYVTRENWELYDLDDIVRARHALI